MTRRVQGGTAGIIAAILSGRLDPLDARLPEERNLPPMSSTDRRQHARREARRAKWIAKRLPF